MGINKNFVVRHGFEASTDLILADADTRKVGIGTTRPERELQVAGGIGATDFYLTGIGTFANELNVGLGGTVLTVLGVGNSIGIGTALPEYLLDIRSPVSTGQTALYIQGDVRITGDLQADDISIDDITLDEATINYLNVLGIGTLANLYVPPSGTATIGVGIVTNLSGTNLNYSGIGTINTLLVGTQTNKATISYVTNTARTFTIPSVAGNRTFAFINQDQTFTGTQTFASLSATTGTITNLNNTNLNVGVATIGILNATTVSISGAAATDFTVTRNFTVAGIATIATGIVTNLSGTNLNYSGIGTITTLNSTNGIITNLSGTNLNYSGISTALRFVSTVSNGTAPLTVGSSTVVTNLNSDLLDGQHGSYYNDLTNSTGTLPDARFTGTYTGVSFNSTGIATFASFSGSGANLTALNATNISSGTLNNARLPSNISVTNLNITGVSTLGTVRVSSGIITATSGIITYYGDGTYLNLTNNPIKGVGIRTEGSVLGFGVTFIDFRGVGVSTTFYNSNVGIATIFFEGGGSGTIGIGTEFPVLSDNGDLFFNAEYARLFVYYDENEIGVGTDAYWIDASPFNISGNVLNVSNDTTTDQEFFPLFTDITTGIVTTSGISTSKLTFNPFTGTLTAIDFNSTSDINLKTNIKTVENALETVNSLRGVSFDWKENRKSSYGVIAQELEEILPELVGSGDVKTVNYNGIIGILIEAIKELKQEIDDLKNTK